MLFDFYLLQYRRARRELQIAYITDRLSMNGSFYQQRKLSKLLAVRGDLDDNKFLNYEAHEASYNLNQKFFYFHYGLIISRQTS